VIVLPHVLFNCAHAAASILSMLSAMNDVSLHEFVAAHREEIIRRCRAKVASMKPAPV